MAYKIHIRVISLRHLLTLRLVTLVMTYQFNGMDSAAMLDYECLNCCWVNTHNYYARWNYWCRKYGDGHLNQVSILINRKIMANLRFTSSWRPCWFSIFGGRWEYFTILFEILTDENVGIDTKTKHLDSYKKYIRDWVISHN